VKRGNLGRDKTQFIQCAATAQFHSQSPPSGHQTYCRPLEQNATDATLEDPNTQTDSRLANAQLYRYTRHVAPFTQIDEHLQTSGIQKMLERIDDPFAVIRLHSWNCVQFFDCALRPRQNLLPIRRQE
jgi:hypothetical protein